MERVVFKVVESREFGIATTPCRRKRRAQPTAALGVIKTGA
jgi:hypothetical protein